MESPKSDGNAMEASAALSPENKSPFSKFVNELSPIKPSRARASMCTQRLKESSFPTIVSVFNSPHPQINRPISFHQRDDIGGSSSNPHRQFFSPSNSALEPRRQLFLPSNSALKPRNPFEVNHGEPGACLNASQVTTGKANDNEAQKMSLVEISDDESMDKMLEFSSENIWNHVESDEFMKHHHVVQGLDSRTTFLGPNSVMISTENGANQATSIQVPSHIMQLNNDQMISPVSRIDGHVDSSCFNQLRIPSQDFVERVDEVSRSQDSSKGKRKKETYTNEIDGCKLCNCKRSKCLKLYCECFAAGIYCEDCCACEDCFNKPDFEDIVQEIRDQIELRNPLAFAPPIVKPPNDSSNIIGDVNSNPSSARHKRGCKCKKSKCLKKYCECYRAKVGCSDGCHCEDCDNSFGKKSDLMFQRAENWKNQSHKMSDSAKAGTANQFSPRWEKFTDINPLIESTHPGSRAVPSLTSHNMRESQNVSQAESEKGTNFHWYSPALCPKQQCPSKVINDICEMIGDDDIPEFIMEDSNMVKPGTPSRKRISPPKLPSYEFGSNFSPGQPTARKKLVLHEAEACIPTPTTLCNSKDRMNQTENDHQGGNHDQ